MPLAVPLRQRNWAWRCPPNEATKVRHRHPVLATIGRGPSDTMVVKVMRLGGPLDAIKQRICRNSVAIERPLRPSTQHFRLIYSKLFNATIRIALRDGRLSPLA